MEIPKTPEQYTEKYRKDYADLEAGDLGEKIATAGFQLGQVSRLEDEARRLRVEAGKCFANGNDQKAKILREIAKEMEVRFERNRQDYDYRYRTSSSVAFELLVGIS